MRSLFLMNILLTLVWAALTGKFDYGNFIFGFIISYAVLWIITRGTERAKYFSRVPKILIFIGFFVKELIKANIQVAYDVITPTNHMKPAIVGIPLDAETELEITLLANFITLTPGTLSMDVSDDKKTIYVHAMYVEDKQDFIDSIKNGFERKLLDILR